MTRIDPFSPEQREAMKTEIKDELRHEERRKLLKRMLTSLLIVLVVFVLPMTYVAAQLAKSGFVDVPVFSKWLFKPGAPSRTVLPLYGSKPEDIFSVIGTKISFDASTSLATVPITESEITTIAQYGVLTADQSKLPFPMKTIQVAIDVEAVEIFVVSPQERRDTTVLLRFRPRVKDGRLTPEIEKLQIGSLNVSSKFATALFAAFGTIVSDEVSKTAGQVGKLQAIKLEPGKAKIVILPKLP